jgi:hypothetical protein
MRNLFALIGLVLVLFAGVGYYRDWYRVQSRQAEAGHQSVNIDINSTKIMSDVEKGIKKLEEKKQELSDSGSKTAASDAKTSDTTAAAGKATTDQPNTPSKNDTP